MVRVAAVEGTPALSSRRRAWRGGRPRMLRQEAIPDNRSDG
uniref:Uncharacterized protein n=1 Tax=Setaria viridis TaxID=4556 RepID=A0A4U6WPK1_SETVI|nr:hypothetical protein SEVIR_1G261100v2 [Setaria viridis]